MRGAAADETVPGETVAGLRRRHRGGPALLVLAAGPLPIPVAARRGAVPVCPPPPVLAPRFPGVGARDGPRQERRVLRAARRRGSDRLLPVRAASPSPGDFPVPPNRSADGGDGPHHPLLVALPEEVFFRGYLYDAFEEAGRDPVLPVALLFAIGHFVIAPSPFRLLTFFPALLLGWGRKRSGNVYVPTGLHFLYNLFPSLIGGSP